MSVSVPDIGKPTLGRLERVHIRDYWQSEAQEFTPWLAQPENIGLLGDTIGLELEVEAQEKSVGPFRADILCKDTTTGHYVLIENQLERTDHSHMGQLMTYAAGLDAATVVWVASRFTDEHRAALDWLNRIIVADFNFFGLEIELWRIDDSPLAPNFNVISQPNDWSKTVRESAAVAQSGELTETQQLRLDFWTQFRQFMEDRGSLIRLQKPSAQYWTSVAVGRANFRLDVWNGMRDNRSGIYLAMTGPHAKTHFHLLRLKHRQSIEDQLGPVEWRELPHAKESQIALVQPTTPAKRETWPELNKWMAETVETWHRVLSPIVKELDAAEYRPSTDQDMVMESDGHITDAE